jgi:glycosyltransferase involved in cell wall biosynthesis
VVPLWRLWTHLRFANALAADRPDLLFVPAHVLPIRHPPRSVVTVHDLGFHHFPEAHPTLARLYLEWSTRFAARQASHLIAISACTAADLQRIYGVPAERITVVYEGVDPSFRPIADEAVRRHVARRYDLGLRPYLFALGTLQPRKNLVGLLRALRLVLDAGHNLQLVLAGRKGWAMGALETELSRLALGPHVKALGYVPDDDLPALYSGALAYVQPSLYEGFGLTVLEAMACATPVVAANTSSLPEVVGGTGLLIDPNRPASIAEAIG